MSTATTAAGHFNPATSSAWQVLLRHADRQKEIGFRVAGAFALDLERASRFTIDAAGLTLDYSKQRITPAVMAELLALAELLAALPHQRGLRLDDAE